MKTDNKPNYLSHSIILSIPVVESRSYDASFLIAALVRAKPLVLPLVSIFNRCLGS